MTISPDDAAAKNLEMIKHRIDKLEKYIDSQLQLYFFGNNSVTISVDDADERVAKEIVRRYKWAGWNVATRTGSSRNEAYRTFIFTKRPKESSDPREYSSPKNQLYWER